MASENVTIQLSTKADLKGFKEVETAATKLNKNIKNLATTFGLAYGAKAVVNFGKASVKAFADDQAAAVKLANAVNNLGMAYANPEIARFISDLEKTSGILDTTLRPAFQALLTTTKDLNASYTLLNDAVDISRGSGIDLGTVVQDLANGYVGITRGLKKYNTGLTQSELKTKSFNDVLDILNKQFSGASSAYLDTYAGKLDVLTVAFDNAKESIGKGLIDAFARLSDGSSIQDAVHSIEVITNVINALVTTVSFAIQGFVKLFKAFDWIGRLGGLLPKTPTGFESKPNKTTKTTTALANTQIKASNALTKAQKANTAEIKKQAALKKQGMLFDLDQIQLVAALKGKLSEEDRKRAELQLALLQGDEEAAKRLTAEIADAIDKTGHLKAYLNSVTATNDPFKNWSTYLDGIEAQAARIAAMGFSAGGKNPSGEGATPPTWNVGGTAVGTGNIGGQVQVSVNFQGADSLSAALRDSFVSASMDGSFSQINRTVGAFDR